MTSHLVSGAAMLAQQMAAAELMERMTAYAHSIDCIVHGDEIQCTARQAELIATWWRENTTESPDAKDS